MDTHVDPQGNILIDEEGSVRLTDFGLGVLSNAHAGSYGSKVGGGAFEHRAPELHDPTVFNVGSGITDRPTPASDTFAFGCVAVEVRLFTTHCCVVRD